MTSSLGTITAVHGHVAKVTFTSNWPAIHDILVVEDQPNVQLEVVASASADVFFCFILNANHRLARGVHVRNTGETLMIPVGEEVLGRAFDIFAQSHDDQPALTSREHRPLFRPTQSNLSIIANPEETVETGIKAIDFFTPLLRGGKTALIGGAGVGKTVILTALVNRLSVARSAAEKHVAVFSAVGERSREAQELRNELAQAGALSFTSIILGQMGENPAIRLRTAFAGATIAEYFRDTGTEVLFFMDNVYRFAQAGHELATLMGQIPSEDGYQPTLTSEMALLNERLISTSAASITSIFAVFVPSDDLTDYGVRSVLPYLDSMIVLSRDVVQAGRYPAIDFLASTSEALNPLTIGEDHYHAYIETKQVLQKAAQLERIVSLVGESELSHDNQKMYRRARLLLNFMTQDLFQGSHRGATVTQLFVKRTDTLAGVRDILAGRYDEVDPELFLYITDLNNPEIQAALAKIKAQTASPTSSPAPSQTQSVAQAQSA